MRVNELNFEFVNVKISSKKINMVYSVKKKVIFYFRLDL